MLVLIYAQDVNGGIGKNNSLPWSHREDLQVFRDMTLYGSVAMGRRTWESLPANVRPLPQRDNIVVSRDYPVSPEYAVCDSIEQLEKDFQGKICFVIGGASLIKAALPYARMIFRTSIEQSFDCDVFVEDIEPRFLEVSCQSYEVNNVTTRHCIYVKDPSEQYTQKYRHLQQRYIHACQGRYPLQQETYAPSFTSRI